MKKLIFLLLMLIGFSLQAQCDVDREDLPNGKVFKGGLELLDETITSNGAEVAYVFRSVGLETDNDRYEVRLEFTVIYTDKLEKVMTLPREVGFRYGRDKTGILYKYIKADTFKDVRLDNDVTAQTFTYELDYDNLKFLLNNPIERLKLRDYRTGKEKLIQITYANLFKSNIKCIIDRFNLDEPSRHPV